MSLATGNGEETFQVVLYDQARWITESGDQNILFQYKSVSIAPNIRAGDTQDIDNNPFASVGISSPAGNTGINYYYKDTQPTSAAPLQNRSALLFSTSPRFKACTLYGYVTDAASGGSVGGVSVYTKHGFIAQSDDSGYWRIQGALAEVPFDITAHKLGFNDSTFTNLQVAEGDSMEIDFSLLHPEFSPTTNSIFDQFDPGLVHHIPFQIFNGGNGRLTWSAEKRLLGDANAAPWDMRHIYNVGDSTHDIRIDGAVFANDHFYVSGANGLDSNMIYVLDRNGSEVNHYQQVGHSRYGFKDLEWDGHNIWGAGEDTVYAFSPDSELVTKWRGPYNPTNNIAWDSDRNLLWVSSATSNIKACTVDGDTAGLPTLNRKGLRIFGLAYWPDDPDGYKLYIIEQPGGSRAAIHKMNIETTDTSFVRSVEIDSSTIKSAFITNQFDVYSWVLMTLARAPGASHDRLLVYQLAARRDWFNLDRYRGTIEADSTQDFTMTLNSNNLPDTLFEGEVRFTHNADGGEMRLHVALQVQGPLPPTAPLLAYPANGDTVKAFPLHGDTLNLPAVQFGWARSTDPNFADSTITYILSLGVRDQKVDIPVSDTTCALNLDTLHLPIWFDTPVNWWVTTISGNDRVECPARFAFSIIPDAVDRGKLTPPVVFGLQSVYPSPFNARTTVRFGADRTVRTTLKTYDILGREVAILYDRVPEVGNYKITWNAESVPSGIYVIRLESAGRMQVQKVALVR